MKKHGHSHGTWNTCQWSNVPNPTFGAYVLNWVVQQCRNGIAKRHTCILSRARFFKHSFPALHATIKVLQHESRHGEAPAHQGPKSHGRSRGTIMTLLPTTGLGVRRRYADIVAKNNLLRVSPLYIFENYIHFS